MNKTIKIKQDSLEFISMWHLQCYIVDAKLKIFHGCVDLAPICNLPKMVASFFAGALKNLSDI